MRRGWRAVHGGDGVKHGEGPLNSQGHYMLRPKHFPPPDRPGVRGVEAGPGFHPAGRPAPARRPAMARKAPARKPAAGRKARPHTSAEPREPALRQTVKKPRRALRAYAFIIGFVGFPTEYDENETCIDGIAPRGRRRRAGRRPELGQQREQSTERCVLLPRRALLLERRRIWGPWPGHRGVRKHNLRRSGDLHPEPELRGGGLQCGHT